MAVRMSSHVRRGPRPAAAWGHSLAGAAAVAALALAALLGGPPPAVAAEVPEAVQACLDCHADESLTLALEDGAEMPVHVAPEGFLASVHGQALVCTDCHERYDEGDHPSGATFASRAAFVRQNGEVCQRCHFETYTRTLESVHFEQRRAGSELAPGCTNCHGAHDIPDPHAKAAMMSRSCGSCHGDVFATYSKSVHGQALGQEGGEDSPACADCHTAHAVAEAGTPGFRMASPDVCVGCHADAEKMARHGVPVDVAQTYLADFHGVTASLTAAGEATDRRVVATCADCHGVHDIASPAALGPEAMKTRVAEVCARCHEGAAPDFPAAWLSHYRPSLRHAPLVYLVAVGYKVFIPFMVVGLVLQVGLHLYRLAARK